MMNRATGRSTVLLTLLVSMTVLSACTTRAVPQPVVIPVPTNTDGLTQQQEAGGITVKVTWQPEAEAPTFQVTLDTHTIALDAYDLAQLAVLRTEAGELQPERWTAAEGGHHRSGMLIFPPTESRALELVIRDVGNVPERTFRWTR